ncbi:hypothetical protein [Chroococcidiopsis thermalis]|uniref:Uncharacterized protein n=1 Tax=Chroococcidiopsis thermalis (strain PCC 7203) TaxID=251229 RepID=K9U8I0_CHRTP|nr:hypothetical protein [Chroococcidiopsis thermalis]AFY91145.1 hypothetical protein Chro_5806 [Chroococcidiopsis thermalis PCC 7203]
MTITTKHFNTKLNQWIHIDNDLNNTESLLNEELNNTLLEYFFPNTEFSFGHMDETSTATELKNHPDGHVLLLSSKSRLLYGPKECLEVIDRLCPDRKDRGAYGSIFLGSCENALAEELSILIVDDTTGRNGSIIDDEQACRLIGDCYGQISTEVYNRLTDREIGTKAPYRVIQHRFGWTSQDGNDTQFRFGKGTLRPNNLDNLDFQDLNNKQKIDLILPLSSFKGTDKDRPGAPLKPQIEPGLYKQKIWLGEKSQSQRGKTAISQLLASFPVGIKDFAEELEAQTKRFKEAQDDPRKLAALYCEKYEKRKNFNEEQKSQLEKEVKQAIKSNKLPEFIEQYSQQLEKYEIDNEGNLEETEPREDLLMYSLIKTDLMSHCQILETEKVQQDLARFVQNEWKDIATGKSLLFERAMVIPSKELKNGEICIPWYNPEEKVLNFRSPFLNSNGLCVSTNKVVEDILGPDRNPLEGAIAVSDETFTQIYNRILAQVKDAVTQVRERDDTFNSDEIQAYLNTNINALDISEKIKFAINFNREIERLNQLGLNIESLVLESEQERQGRDYDGDCIGFTLAKCYPYLAEEAEYRNQLENAYAPTSKLKKQSFYAADGAQPEFEEIAIHMSDGISVGAINNHLTAIEALESEITILKNYSTAEEKSAYLDAVAKHYKKILPTILQEEQKQRERNPDERTRQTKQDYIQYMQKFVELASVRDRSDEIIQKAFSINSQMYRKMIQSAAFQNQIAVDLFKSAKKPDMEAIAENSRYLYREVDYIRDKKNKNVYIDRGIQANGYSPVEIIISKTNEYFEQAKLESRPTSQFSKLFDSVEFTHQDKLQVTLAKKEFDDRFGKATQIKKRRGIEQGPYLVINGQSGKQIEVTNLIRYNHPGIWQAQEIKFKIEEIPKHKRSPDRPHQFIVLAQINGELNENSQPYFRRLGNLSQESENLNLKTGVVFTSIAFGLRPEISEGQAKILFQKASEVAENFYFGVPEAERVTMAAATWEISTTKQQGETSTNNSEDKAQNSTNKVSNFVFTAFKNELVERLQELQFKDFTLVSLKAESEALKPENTSKTYQAKFDLENGERVVKVQYENGEYTTLGTLQAQTPRLPLGTTATVSVALEKAATATATIQIPGKPEISLKINEIRKFQYADTNFNGETVNLQIVSGKVPKNNEIDIYIDGKRFGSIDAESTQEAEAKGWIKLDKNGSTQLKLKFKSIATEGAGAYLIAETSTGDLLKIHKINDEFKGIKYDDREFRTLSASSRGYKEKVFFAIDNKTVGVLNNTKESIAALNALKTAGLFNGSSSTLPCKMQSNFTSCIVTVDSNTVQYPKTWVKESSLNTTIDLQQNFSQKNRQQIHSQIHNIITERPTILFQSQEDKMLGLVGLAIDSRKVDTVSKWLTKVGIEYSQISPAEAKRESKKGLAVFMLSGSTIRPEILENLNTKFGKVADASSPISDIPITEQSILFYNPHQSYTDGNTNTTIQTEAYGLVVPAQDSIVVSSWLSSQGIKIQSFIEKNCIAFVIERKQFNDEFIRQIVSELGGAIDVSTVEGYEQYEQKLNLLNENLNQSGTSILQANILAKSEYQLFLDRLPARPKELLGQRENAVAVITPAAPQQLTGTLSDSNDWVATQVTDASLTDTRRERIAASTGQPTAKQNSQLSIREIVAYGNQVTARATSPQIPENPIVSGKPVPMVYDLHTYDELKTLPVNTTIDAMRGYGRVHTTRGINYEKAYGIKEGDIAIAVGKDGRQVAFRVGKQYEISTEAIADPTYQQAWAAWEKHSVQELTQTQASKGKIYGLFMEPLGDYIDGKIVPFPALQQTEQPNAPPTLRSQVHPGINISSGSQDPLGAVLTNPTVKSKAKGRIQGDYPVSFRDNPEVKAGTYGPETYTQDKPAGVPFASAEQAYQHYKTGLPLGEERIELIAEIIQAKLEQHPKLLQAIASRGGVQWLENCTHYVTATQDSYWEGRGDRSPFLRALMRGYTQTREIVLSTLATAAPDSNALLTSEPSVAQMQSALSWNGFGSENLTVTTDKSIDNWLKAATILGKPPAYIQRIEAVKAEWEATGKLSDKARSIMQADLATLCSASELASYAKRIAKILGTNLPNNSLQAIGKHYDVLLDSQKQTLSISDKNGNKIFDIQQGKIHQQQLTPEVITYFKVANVQIDSALKHVQKNLLEP